MVTNTTGGSATSSPAMLTVLDSPPMITVQPVSITNNAGTTAVFNVASVGAVPMNYQWRKNGANLAASGVSSGLITLTLNNVEDADAASYTVVITNDFGSVTITGYSHSDGRPAGYRVNRLVRRFLTVRRHLCGYGNRDIAIQLSMAV